MEFATAPVSWEAGRIMRTCGLSTPRMNDLLVDLEEQQGERWRCLLLDYTDAEERRIAVKPANLVDLPPPSEETTQLESTHILREHMKHIHAEEWEQAREVLVLSLIHNPASGILLNLMGDWSNYAGLPPAEVVKHMRRGVANCSGVLEDDAQRVFQARIGYSGALGNMENAAGLAGEQQQLEICMTECQGNLPMMVHWTPTLLVMYVGSLRKSRHLDKALAVLQALEKLPRPFECPAWDVEDRLSRTSNKLGADLYAIGCTLENQVAVAVQGVKAWRAEPPREEWTAESARIHGLLEAALECFQKSCVALGTDELGNKPMAQAACTRVAQMLSLYPH